MSNGIFKKLLKPSDSGNILIFLFGLALAGFATGVGMKAAEVFFKGTVKKIDNQMGLLPPEYAEEIYGNYG